MVFSNEIETLEIGGPCRPLKLMQMGTQGVHMQGVLPWLVDWARHAVRSLAALVAQHKIFCSLWYTIICPHLPASLAGSCAAPTVS